MVLVTLVILVILEGAGKTDYRIQVPQVGSLVAPSCTTRGIPRSHK